MRLCTLTLSVCATDAQEQYDQACALQDALRACELDLSVRERRIPAQSGRAAQELALGQLLVELAPEVLAGLFGVLSGWLVTRSAGRVRIKLAGVEVEFDRGTSEDEIVSLIARLHQAATAQPEEV